MGWRVIAFFLGELGSSMPGCYNILDLQRLASLLFVL